MDGSAHLDSLQEEANVDLQAEVSDASNSGMVPSSADYAPEESGEENVSQVSNEVKGCLKSQEKRL